MSDLAVWRERWLAIYRHEQVRVWSPLPCDDECLPSAHDFHRGWAGGGDNLATKVPR